jgi:hypothetical protein
MKTPVPFPEITLRAKADATDGVIRAPLTNTPCWALPGLPCPQRRADVLPWTKLAEGDARIRRPWSRWQK